MNRKERSYMPAYLDNAATTKPCEEAVAAALAAMTDNYGNPSSLHRVGLNAELPLRKPASPLPLHLSASLSASHSHRALPNPTIRSS